MSEKCWPTSNGPSGDSRKDDIRLFQKKETSLSLLGELSTFDLSLFETTTSCLALHTTIC